MPQPHDRCVVICLCAEWCNVCREYRATFDAFASEFPEVRFAWVDIEDSPDVVGPIDIDNFPTLAIGVGDTLAFFGALNPQRDVLRRVLTSTMGGGASVTPQHDELGQLYRRLRAHAGEEP